MLNQQGGIYKLIHDREHK